LWILVQIAYKPSKPFSFPSFRSKHAWTVHARQQVKKKKKQREKPGYWGRLVTGLDRWV
jgi:hypothetical protein